MHYDWMLKNPTNQNAWKIAYRKIYTVNYLQDSAQLYLVKKSYFKILIA